MSSTDGSTAGSSEAPLINEKKSNVPSWKKMVKSMSMRNNNKTSKKKQKNKKNRLFGKKKDELNSNSIASRENSTVSYTELDDNDNVTPPEPSIATSQLEDTKATDAAPPDLTTENKDSASSGVEEVVTDKAEPTLAHEYQQEVPVETTAILDDSSHSQTRSLSINISSGHMDIEQDVENLVPSNEFQNFFNSTGELILKTTDMAIKTMLFPVTLPVKVTSTVAGNIIGFAQDVIGGALGNIVKFLPKQQETRTLEYDTNTETNPNPESKAPHEQLISAVMGLLPFSF